VRREGWPFPNVRRDGCEIPKVRRDGWATPRTRRRRPVRAAVAEVPASGAGRTGTITIVVSWAAGVWLVNMGFSCLLGGGRCSHC
jgi:hypothetical protein